MTFEEYAARDEERIALIRPFLIGNDLTGFAKAVYDMYGRGSYCWVDDFWHKLVPGTQTKIKRNQATDAAMQFEWEQDKLAMEADEEAVVLKGISREIDISAVSPAVIAEFISFKVMTIKGKQQVRIDAYNTTHVCRETGEFPSKTPVAEIIRVLRKYGAKEIKREKRPGRPTGYDGWAW